MRIPLSEKSACTFTEARAILSNFKKENLKKKIIVILAVFGLTTLGGVFAATSIQINSGTPISLGTGYTAATTCDDEITVSTGNKFSTSNNLFQVETITVSGVNESSCGNKVMEMSTLVNGSLIVASWSIASTSNTNASYLFASNTNYQFSGSTLVKNAKTAIPAINMNSLSNIALSIMGDNWILGSWTATMGDSNRYWSSIGSSADGKKLIANQSGSGDAIWTSTDSGATWTPRVAAPVEGVFTGVASSADGVKLIMAASVGYIYISSDSGATWDTRTAAGSRYWQDVASSADGTKLAAVAAVNGYIWTSTDSGATWTTNSNSSGTGASGWNNIASSADGNTLIACIGSGSTGKYIWISTNSGITWSSITSTGQQAWLDVASSSDGTKLAAVANNGYIWTSTDSGATWTTNSNSSGQRSWRTISSSADGTKLAAAVSTGYIYTSTDSGATWTEQSASGSRNWYGVTMSADGKKIAAVVHDGFIYTASFS